MDTAGNSGAINEPGDLGGPKLLEQALEHHKAGRLAEAEHLYDRVLEVRPDQPDALYFLGLIADQMGRSGEAAELIGRANGLDPKNAEKRDQLGSIFKADRLREQELAEAKAAVAAEPGNAGAHYRLGATFERQGQRAEAAAAFQEAIAIKPDYAEAHNGLGNVLKSQGRLEEAVHCYQQVIALKPDAAGAYNSLGGVFVHLGRPKDAVASYREAIALRPDFAEAHGNLGNALRALGELDDALASLQRAAELKPDAATIHFNLSAALYDLGKLEDAVAAYKRAIGLDPGLLMTHSRILLRMNYDPARTAADIWAEARRCGDLRVGSCDIRMGGYANSRDPERRLRLGYVSPNFTTHSVSYFFEPLLAAHDPGAVRVFCYAEVERPDKTTKRLEAMANRWRWTVGMSDAELAERVRRDRIDILVDLAGHTPNNRLGVFAMKPAPVQVTWLGYPGTTGLSTIDYRFTDAVVEPPGEADGYSSEALVRLPHGFHCYGPPADAPEVGPLPCREAGHLTFGSFNNLAKVTHDVVAAWARVLHAVPNARMVIKGGELNDLATRQGYLEAFAGHGIEAGRLDLVAWIAERAGHLDLYGRIDVALDTFPYNGTTTTCEALWMGVPVVTLAGDRHAGRVGASLLTQLGLEELVAETVEAYVAEAVDLAKDVARLAALRAELRGRMTDAPLCNRAGFARAIEAAYRDMWRRWCGSA